MNKIISLNKSSSKNYTQYTLCLVVFMLMFGGVFIACDAGDKHASEHAHDEDHEGEHEHEHDNAHRLNAWGNKTQVMLEYALPEAGKPLNLVAHITRLKDYQPASQNSLKYVAWFGESTQPAGLLPMDLPFVKDGIFAISIDAPQSKEATLNLVLSDDFGEVDHHVFEHMELSEEGHEDHNDHGDHDHEEGHEEAIALSLEKQWNIAGFQVTQSRHQDVAPSISAFAHITLPPQSSVDVLAPRQGRILMNTKENTWARVGQNLEQGEALFYMTSASTVNADPAKLDLAVEQAQLQLNAAQKEVNRIKPLVDQGVVASKRLIQAELERDVARAALRSAQRSRSSLNNTQKVGRRADAIAVPSPISGQLVELYVAPGSWVSQGQKLASIVDSDELWLDVDIPEAYVSRVKSIEGVWFEAGKDNIIHLDKEKLVSLGPTLHTGRRTLPVRFRLQRNNQELFAGMTTNAKVIVEKAHDAVVVPFSALVPDKGNYHVYVQKGAESFERREVRTGTRDGQWIEIINGVRNGEWVVSRGVNAVKLAASSPEESIGHGHAH